MPKNTVPASRKNMMATFSRFVSAGKTKRRRKYITNGKLSAVPPHMAMDMICPKPPVMLRLTILIFPAASSSEAGAFSHESTVGENTPVTTQQITHDSKALIKQERNATMCSMNGRGGSLYSSGFLRSPPIFTRSFLGQRKP